MLDAESKKNLLKISVGSIVCSAIVAAVFIIIGQFDLSVVFGLLIGLVLSIGNFYAMSVTVAKALETGDENEAKKRIRNSYLIRTGIMVAVIAVSIIVKQINPIPVLLSVFYVRLTIFITGLFEKKKKPEDGDTAAPADEAQEIPPEAEAADEEEEEQPDEFEKFVKRFSKGPVPGEENKNTTEKQ